MDEKRLKSFEDMLKAILSQYESAVEKMAKLKAEGKEKTVTYHQFFCEQAATSGDVELLQDVWAYRE